jgi:hypothetical protein
VDLAVQTLVILAGHMAVEAMATGAVLELVQLIFIGLVIHVHFLQVCFNL